MGIHEMHTYFRTLGQQVGMQLIRAILPESIDVFINQTIIEKSRNTVLSNVSTVFNDRVAIQDNSISPINALRTLYKKSNVDVTPVAGNDYYKAIVGIDKTIMFYTSFGINYQNGKKHVGCRFIEGDKVYDTLRDYCNTASWDYPIVTMFVDDDGKEYLEIYINSTTKIPTTLEINYIELPKMVKWDSDTAKSVDCNLPEYIHNEIVELAVSKYFKSIGATTAPVTRN